MRILHVITSLQTGGAEHLMVDLLPLLRSNGKNTVELLVFDGRRSPFMDELESRGIYIHKLGNGGSVYHPKYIFRLIQYIGRFDIIHAHNTACQLFVPIAKLLSFTRKSLATTEHSTNNRRRSKWWCKPLDRWMYNRYAAVICIADQTRVSLEQYLGKRKNFFTIWNGVDVSRFRKPIKSIAGQSDFIITMVAGLRVEKDHETLLRALAQLPSNYRLQLVGDGERKESLMAMCKELGLESRVSFLGVRMDVPDILEQSDVAVLSSHWEGFGLAAVEAMAAGRPLVATDVGGLHDVVSGAGILFSHGDDKALAEKIRHLCEHPDEYRSVAEQCQKRAMKYDISIMARKYLELYKAIV